MMTSFRILQAVLLAVSIITPTSAQTPAFPTRAVQVIADSSAGSAPDVSLRYVAERLGQLWGQQVLVVNRPGAGGSVAARAAADATPDGYTLYQPVLSTFVTLNRLAPNVPIILPRDFLPIGFIEEAPMFIGVSPSLGVSDLKGLIALAKQKPEEITFAATGIGRLTHLTGELLQHAADFKLHLIPYTGAPSQAMSDIATGRVAVMIEGYPGIAGAARAGSIKLIAVASTKRLPEFPDVPTVAETIPNFQATGWAVLVGPLGTPESIIRKINYDLHKVSTEPELLQRLAAIGTYPNPMTPDEVLAFVNQQQRVWQPVLDHIAKRQK